MKARFIILFYIIIFCLTTTSADNIIQHEGLFYQLREDSTAVVTYSRDSTIQYTGDIQLPEEIVHENIRYLVTEIDSAAFKGTPITSIRLTNNIKAIGDYAFYRCKELETCNMGNDPLSPIDSIGDSAFSYCGIKRIYGNRRIKKLKEDAFRLCSSLEAINKNVIFENIGKSAFLFCIRLNKSPLCEGVEKIGEGAFTFCKFDSIYIPPTVKEIGINPFELCENLVSIEVSSDNTSYNSNGDCNAIIKTDSKELISSCRNTIIPNDCRIIGEVAFWGNYIQPIHIPSSVHYIGYGAFSFRSLQTIIFEGEYSKIVLNADRDASWSTAQHKALCKRIWSNRDNEDIDYLYIGKYWIFTSNSLKFLHLPDSIENIPKGLVGNGDSISFLAIPSSVKTIEEDAFSGCKNLQTMVIPGSVEDIGGWRKQCFQGCDNLTIYTPLDSAKYEAFEDVKRVVQIPEIELIYCHPYTSYIYNCMKNWKRHTPYESDKDWQQRVNNRDTLASVEERFTEAYIAANTRRVPNRAELGRYNANLEFFPIRDSNYGTIKINVPYDEWQYFKNNWDNAKKDFTYRISEDAVVYNDVTITLPNGKMYKSEIE